LSVCIINDEPIIIATRIRLKDNLLVALSRACIRFSKIADDLIKRGELSQSKGKEFVVDLLDIAEKEKDKLVEKIQPEIEKSLEKMNFALKNRVDELGKKIDKLERKIDKLLKKME